MATPPNRVQSLRSSIAGGRPPNTRQPGEIYTNWPDRQIGVMDSASNPMDLVGVRFFSTTANYAIGDHVIQAGALYKATAIVPAGAFNPNLWTQIGGSVAVGATPPSNPQNGGMWFNSATGALMVYNASLWTQVGLANVADAAPANPQNGQLWFDSVAAQLYVFYVDPSGPPGQWVIANNVAGAYLPIGGGTVTGATSFPVVIATTGIGGDGSGNPPKLIIDPPAGDNSAMVPSTRWVNADIPSFASGFVNRLRNGTFDVWQRGASLTALTNGGYTADGWMIGWSGTAPASVGQNAVGAGATFGGRFSYGISGAAGNTLVQLTQRIESFVSAQLGGVAITFSCWVLSSIALQPQIQVGSPATADAFPATVSVGPVNLQPVPVNVWTRLAYTFTLPAGAALNGVQLWLLLGALASGTVQVAAADLRATPGLPVGLCAAPPPPELRPIATELEFCQRYYEIVHVATYVPGTAGTQVYTSAYYQARKRAGPTATLAANNCVNLTAAPTYIAGLNGLAGATFGGICTATASTLLNAVFAMSAEL